jgi:hypothetical protein
VKKRKARRELEGAGEGAGEELERGRACRGRMWQREGERGKRFNRALDTKRRSQGGGNDYPMIARV